MSEREMIEPKWDPKQFRKVTDEELAEARAKAYKAMFPETEENLRDAVRDLPHHAQIAVLSDVLVAHVRFIEANAASDKDLDELRKRVDKLDSNSGSKGKSLKDIFLGTLVGGFAGKLVEAITSLPGLLGMQTSTLARKLGVPNRE